MDSTVNALKTCVEFSTLKHEHVEGAVECLAESFMDEPICRTLGLPKEALLDFLHPRIELTAKDGLSCVAIEGGKVVSVAFNDSNSELPVPYANEEKWNVYFEPIFKLLDQLHQVSAIEQQMHAEGLKFFHMFFWATLPEARGKGYLKKLVEMSLTVAQAKGFEVAVVEATSPVSQFTCQKFDFMKAATIFYKDIPELSALSGAALELYLRRL